MDAPVPPCPPVVVVAPDAPLTCDLDGSQLLVEYNTTEADCNHAGGMPVTIVNVRFCVGLDY